MTEPKLTIELVPETCWYTNVRSNVSTAEWELCKQFVRERSNNRCEICGSRGPRWPVECHEVWEYEERITHGPPLIARMVKGESQLTAETPVAKVERIQRLTGLIALCPDCHSVKHIGRAEAQGGLHLALQHLTTVNGWTRSLAEHYAEGAFRVWRERSRYEWTLDISYLSEILDPEVAQ